MKKKSSCSAEIVGSIDELLTQILERVPALSLIRSKCVSKQWLSLISDPDFHRRHTFQNPNPKILAFLSPETNQDQKHRPVYVVNPTTNQFRALFPPTLRDDVTRSTLVRYALAFDPSQSPHYKVLCVTNDDDDGGHHDIEIYSSETGEWKHLKTPYFPRERAMHFGWRSRLGAVYCNGAVHWLRSRHEAGLRFGLYGGNGIMGFRREKKTGVLHYFEISQERFLVVSAIPPVPSVVKNIPLKGNEPTTWPNLAQRYFGVCGGRLYLIETYDHCLTQFDVMEMEKDYSGWFVKYQVDLNPLVAAFPGQDCNVFVVLCLFQEEETDYGVEDTSTHLLLHLSGKVISYNLRSKTFRTSVELVNKELALGNHLYLEDVVFPYMETLTCL
ncbi:PREDICTED: F-box protein At5g07610-like [Fragaria vesca subsp. vesca]|uniref:F-box protein At5g07610-like n=1 Tax=Fragaria vesca subsp. vesca TaxID=101020 RepID=UPI0002C303E2|nr:PREDICTED: F-box protein At5g07610-like [Fragaria vesca subsp. vesca]